MRGLYIHIPFCVKKCGYCDFYSEVGGDAELQLYLDAVEREFEIRAKEFGPLKPETIFFGGGTPTKLSADQLTRLGEIIHRQVDVSSVSEWTSEINPGTLNKDKAQALADMGMNRASIGIQSFNPKWLRELDRTHEEGKAQEALELARDAGINNISVDLMFALPGQTLEEWQDDLEKALALKTQHISLYALTFEDDTPLTMKMQRGEVEPMNADTAAEFYDYTVKRCRQDGFERYEVSNFAKPGLESKHNTLYWECDNWLGIGAAAHSAFGQRRWANGRDYKAYMKALLDEDHLPVAYEEENTIEQYADEILMMGLRLATGVETQAFAEKTGMKITDYCGDSLENLSQLELIQWDGATLRLTDKGFRVLDKVVLELTSVEAGVTQG